MWQYTTLAESRWLGLSDLVNWFESAGIRATTQVHFGQFKLSLIMANSVKMDDFLTFKTQ